MQRGKTIVGGMTWIAVIVYANRSLGLVTTLILAKLLSPSDFGLVAIASVTIEALRIFRDMGLSEALIYHEDESEAHLHTAHTILVSFNVLLFVMVSASAPLVARFFQNAMIAPVLIVMSSNLVWDANRAVARALYRKRFKFRQLVVPEVVPVVLAAFASISLAFAGFGVWSLVVRTVLHSILGMLLLRSAYRPRFRFDRRAARELLRYGKFIAGTSVVLVALHNIDKFYVGKLVGLDALGMFELAMRISDLPVKEFSFIVGSVMFPVLSKMRDSREESCGLFLRMLRYTAYVSVPLAIGLSTYGPPAILAVYGPKWAATAAALQILALYAVFRSLSSLVCDAFKAGGHPNVVFRFMVLRLVSVGSLGIPAIKWYGLLGISTLLVITYAVTLVWEVHVLKRILGVTARQCLAALAQPVLLSAGVIPGIYWLTCRLVGPLALWQLALSATLTGAVYVGMVALFDGDMVRNVMRIVRMRQNA